MTLAILKAVHLFAAFAWMAGLWYYPRLLIYQRKLYDKEGKASEKLCILQIMSQRLMRYILMPAMVMNVIVGLWFAVQGGYREDWLYGKFLCVLLLIVCSVFFARFGRQMREGRYLLNTRQLRLLNEIPTAILIAILFLVVVYPEL